MYLSVVFISCSCCSFNPCKLPLAAVGGWVLFKANCLSFCGSFWSIRSVYSTRNKFYLIGCFRLHTKFVCSIISVLCLQTLFVLLMCTNNCVSNLCCINWLTGSYQLLVLGNVVILFTKVQISNCLYTTSLLYNVISPMSFALCRDMCSTCTLSRFLPPCVHVCTVYAFVCVLVFVFGVFSLPSLVNSSLSLSHLMQEAEQPLGAGVYDTPTFSKPALVKQVMDMPTYSDVFQSKVNIHV